MNAIETHALTRRFGPRTAVDGLDLTVRQGELFALLGVNGAGKTTTLRMLSGLLQPTSGEADILGFRLTQQPQEIKRRINLSPQETAVAPNLTVRENLELIAGIYGASRREAAQRAAETIAEFHLGEVERSRAKTLSGGWQRRLSIAMALISQPAGCAGAAGAVAGHPKPARQSDCHPHHALSRGGGGAFRPHRYPVARQAAYLRHGAGAVRRGGRDAL